MILAKQAEVRGGLTDGRTTGGATTTFGDVTGVTRRRFLVGATTAAVAGPALTGVAGASNWFDGLFGVVARHEPYAELAKYTVGVEHGGTVDLGERVAQRREMGGGRDP